MPDFEAGRSVLRLPEPVGHPGVGNVSQPMPRSVRVLAEGSRASELELPAVARPGSIVQLQWATAARKPPTQGEQSGMRPEPPFGQFPEAEKVDSQLTVVVLRDQLEASIPDVAQSEERFEGLHRQREVRGTMGRSGAVDDVRSMTCVVG